ncbi:Hypothetical predicted protein [Pelobates cultripes]|uniref:Uncharacterized protein n=1 Tax=Pelobates cultripes TaxID=61616 RepID=A0AAD1SSC2_PELCU|nr:Hypothetical predicted protein [Pelobates cultripes]
MINSAVAASMEKAIAKLLVQNPSGDPNTKDPHRSTGEIATSKHHWKGSGPAPPESEGQGPTEEEPPDRTPGPFIPSDDEEHNPPPSLEVMD